MLQREQIIINLINSGDTFLLTGPAGCGKTRFLETLFRKQKVKYIRINCTLADKKPNFLKLLNHQISVFLNFQDSDKLNLHSSLQNWLNQIRQLVQNQQYKNSLDNVYLFFDCVQELKIPEKFLQQFYQSCKQELSFKFNFVFCGIQLGTKQQQDAQPFKKIINFCMVKPQNLIVKEVIYIIVKDVFESYKLYNKFFIGQAQTIQQYQKALKYITTLLTEAFEITESNLNKIKRMTKIITKRLARLILEMPVEKKQGNKIEQEIFQQQSKDYIKRQNNKKSIYKYVLKLCLHNSTAAKIIRIVQSKQQFPDYAIEKEIENPDQEKNQMHLKLQKKKDTKNQTVQSDGNIAINSNYPSLIMAAVYLADIYNESDDKKRFTEQRNIGERRLKEYRKNLPTGTKHNLQRIVAISQALQGARDQSHYPMQTLYLHHSLDYYTCFQFLQQSGLIKSYGKHYTWGKGKVFGRPDEKKVVDYFRTVGIDQKQYME